jgi:cell division protease FtsH
MTKGELESRIQVLLAGTVAEEMVFADISSGAQNDLERCTEIARSMVMDFGMSRLGRVNFRESHRSPFLAVGGGDGRMSSHSEQTAREIDEEVKRIIDEGLERVRHILAKRRAALDAISEELMKQEVIDSETLTKIIEENSPSPMIVPGTDSEPRRSVKLADAEPDAGSSSVGG